MKISSLKIDSAKIEAGAWVNEIAGLPGVRLRVRGLGCSAYRDLQAKKIADLPRDVRVKGIPSATLQEIETECLVETILLDWRGIDSDEVGADEKPIPLPWSKETARLYLTDPDYLVLRGGVLYAAQVVADIGEADLKDDLGN